MIGLFMSRGDEGITTQIGGVMTLGTERISEYVRGIHQRGLVLLTVAVVLVV